MVIAHNISCLVYTHTGSNSWQNTIFLEWVWFCSNSVLLQPSFKLSLMFLILSDLGKSMQLDLRINSFTTHATFSQQSFNFKLLYSHYSSATPPHSYTCVYCKSAIFSLLSFLKKKRRLMRSPSCLCRCVCPPSTFQPTSRF
jgi:hypothetical protein